MAPPAASRVDPRIRRIPPKVRWRKDCAVGDEALEIPLFPLDAVLFPGMALPLHIFEPCYREMMGRCLDNDMPFGVVRALTEHDSGAEVPARVGTLARISDYERLPDGRYNLLATGAERFEIIELRHTHSYLTGLVRPLRDTGASDDPSYLVTLSRVARAALKAYLRTMLKLLGSEDYKITVPIDPTELSYLIGMCLTCEDNEKQQLLEMRTVADRLAKGTALLRMETEALARQIESETHPSAPVDRSQLN
jgi:Lon protease-like protein